MNTALEAALKRREPLADLAAIRLFDGAGDGIPGLLIDRIGAVVIVRLHAGSRAETLDVAVIQKILSAVPQVRAGVLWRHSGDAAETTRYGAENLFGEVPDEYQIQEAGVTVMIRPLATPSAGFFTDMRDLRSELSGTSLGHRVLNTFCFTGSLGLAAWVGGAKEVVQVDISKSALSWARRNAELNEGNNQGEIRYIPEDTLSFLNREVRRVERGKERYDTVIIDPPVFGSSKGVRFVQQSQWEPMVHAALKIVISGGRLFLTSNHSSVTPEQLESIVEQSAKTIGVGISEITYLSPPKADFTAIGTQSTAMRGLMVGIAP